MPETENRELGFSPGRRKTSSFPAVSAGKEQVQIRSRGDGRGVSLCDGWGCPGERVGFAEIAEKRG